MQHKRYESKTWVYVFVRLDLPLQQQLVQSGHACLQAGIFFGDVKYQDVSNLVLLGVQDKAELIKVNCWLLHNGINHAMFNEPDYEYGLTAIATRPVYEEEREIFKGYSLWKA